MMYEHHSDVHQSPAYGPLGTADPIGLLPVGVQKETLSRYLTADPESGSRLRLEVIQSPAGWLQHANNMRANTFAVTTDSM
jgi:hypothetical protein